MQSRTWAGLLLAAGLACAGAASARYFRDAFSAKGLVFSDGGVLGWWRSTPQGCSRDPLDGQPTGKSRTVLALFWGDPASSDPAREQHLSIALDAPMRLEIAHNGGGFAATLDTVKTMGTLLDGRVCSKFHVQTKERSATFAEGRPTLGGTLELDCQVQDSHLTADVRFSGCEF